jgi:hypothetical protein
MECEPGSEHHYVTSSAARNTGASDGGHSAKQGQSTCQRSTYSGSGSKLLLLFTTKSTLFWSNFNLLQIIGKFEFYTAFNCSTTAVFQVITVEENI